MSRQRHTAEQITGRVREAEVLKANGLSMEEVLRKLVISNAAYYKWRAGERSVFPPIAVGGFCADEKAFAIVSPPADYSGP